MKIYKIRELFSDGSFEYDDVYSTREEAGLVIEEYENDDKAEPREVNDDSVFIGYEIVEKED